MQLWMCLTNLTNSPMPAVNHCFFFFFSPHQVAIWNMTDSVGIRTSKWNQTKWQSVERGGGHRTPVPPMEKFGRWGCYMGGFWLTRTELQYWAQLSERKDKHQTMPFYFLSYWTANTISSANWPQNKQTHIHNLGSVICCFRSNNAIMSLREPCKGDCYLVFHIHDSGPSRGQGIDFLFFFFFSSFRFPASGASVCEISFYARLCWHFLSILRIPRPRWYFLNRSVWSEAVWWRRTICHPLRGLDCTCHRSVAASHLEALPN